MDNAVSKRSRRAHASRAVAGVVVLLTMTLSIAFTSTASADELDNRLEAIEAEKQQVQQN